MGKIYIGWRSLEGFVEGGKEIIKDKVSVHDGRTGEEIGWFEINSPKIPEGCIICKSGEEYWKTCEIYAETEEMKASCRRHLERVKKKKKNIISWCVYRQGMTEAQALEKIKEMEKWGEL